MKLLGRKVREYRKRLKLSQAELAEGICTQATISQMEKRDQIPTLRITLQLCHRLNVHWRDIVEGVLTIPDEWFLAIEQDLMAGRLDDGARRLQQFPQQTLTSQFDQERFHYLLGFEALLVNRQPEKAIFHFQQLLSRLNDAAGDATVILINLGLAMAYQRSHQLTRCLHFLTQADNALAKVTWHDVPCYQRFIWAELLCGELHLQVGDPHAALMAFHRAMTTVRYHDVMFLLDQLYRLRGQAEQALQMADAAKISFERAAMLMAIKQQGPTQATPYSA